MKKKIGFIIIGRLKSKRLPNKLLKKIGNKIVLEHLIDRIKYKKIFKNIIFCTSNLNQDQKLAKIIKSKKIKFFKGDPVDVVDRIYRASIKEQLTHILYITADNPFFDFFYAKKVLGKLINSNFDLIRAFDLPYGAFCYGIKVSSLKKILEIKAIKESTNWERYYTETGLFKVHDLKIKNKSHRWSKLRLTLDYEEDLRFLKKIYKDLSKKNLYFNLKEVIPYIKKNPDILKINQFLTDFYLKKYKKETKLVLKKNVKIKKKKYKNFIDYLK